MKNILVPLNLSTIEKTRIRHKIMGIVRNKCESIIARFFDTRYTYLYNNWLKLFSEIVYSIFQLSFISY